MLLRSLHSCLSLNLHKPSKPNFLLLSNLHSSPNHELAKTLAIQLDSCVHPKHLTQIHTHLLRRHLLLSHFHWNSLMRSYLRLSLPLPSLLLFSQMHRLGLRPDLYTLPITLKASCHVYTLSLGLQLHSVAVKNGLDQDEYSESGIISVYAKSGEFGSARKVFDENPQRRIGSWNAMISGFTQGGHAVETVGLFGEMRRGGVVPDGLTMVSVVSACGSLGDIRIAEQVHRCVLQVNRLERHDVILSNSLVDMYSKCGRTDLAHQVFTKMPQRNVSTWTAMITGLGTHGQEKLALEFFERMMEEGVRPNHVTMVAVLNACSHGGLVEQGMSYLSNMKELYGVEPRVAHYGCVVDMLGKAGRVKEAKEVAEDMPMGANAVVWGTLLGASEKHADVEVGEWAASKLVEVEPWNDGVYVVLSNIYAAVGMWWKVEEVRKVMRERRVEKNPGFSYATRDL